MAKKCYYKNNGILLSYYETENNLQPLVLLHAQGVDHTSFDRVLKKLSAKFHIYAVDYYGHGESLHDAQKYNIVEIGSAIIDFIQNVIKEKVFLLGHSSGGLIAAYIAANSDLCARLFLEDPPFFSSQGERRKSTFNYIDLSTLCHKFINRPDHTDFVLYYFENQYAWNFFPEQPRAKIRDTLTAAAAKYRRRHPDRNLKVPFWPKSALLAFCGMNNYDPHFGETFYNDSFHAGISHESILRRIDCPTIFMKAKTEMSENGILMAALSDADLEKAESLIKNCRTVRFDCGHSIHVEKKKEFINCLLSI